MLGSVWINYGIMEAVEDKSDLYRYVWMSGFRVRFMSSTMHLNFQSLCLDERSKKPEKLTMMNIVCIYYPNTACVLVYLGPVKILK